MKKIFCLLLFTFIFELRAEINNFPLPSDDPKELYLETIKRCITDSIYKTKDISGIDRWARPNMKEVVQYYPGSEQTMMARWAADKLHELMDDVERHQVPGDFIETGVWRGGLTIFMRAFLKAHGDTTRKVWVADSFQGLPKPNYKKYPDDKGLDLSGVSWLKVSLEEVKANFARYGLLDEQVVFLKGWFSETLPTAPIEKIAIARLDGDLYESTMDALVALYPKIAVGGYIIIDDYGAVPACAKAVHDYRTVFGINDVIYPIDWTQVYWQKTK